MTFGSTFGRVFSPTFQPKSQAVASSASTWWDLNGTITSCVAAYQPKGAASYAASKVNLANAGTYDAKDGAAYPTWDSAKGWTFNGTTNNRYLTTGILTDLGMSWIVRIANAATNNGDRAVFGGIRGGAPYDGLGFQNALSSNKHSYINGGLVSIASNVASGVFAAAGTNVYKDGTDEGDLTNSGDPNVAIYIGCLNYGGSSRIQYYAGDIIALALYEAVLTSTQIGNLTTAMNAL